MDYWSKASIERDQVALFAPTLDSWIPEDHPVWLFDEILSNLDWSQWESQYFGCIGQPPIHPKTLAGVILYGLSMGIRSSRTLEACVPILSITCGLLQAEGLTTQLYVNFVQGLAKNSKVYFDRLVGYPWLWA